MDEAISYYSLMIIGYLAHDILAFILDLRTKKKIIELKRINISREGKLFNVSKEKKIIVIVRLPVTFSMDVNQITIAAHISNITTLDMGRLYN